MPTLNDLKPAENFVALVVGKAGSGKSSALASFASKDAPMYVFDVDHRIKGIQGSREFIGEDAWNNITFDQYDVIDGFKSIETQFMEFSIKYDKKQLQYKNIVIDSVGSLGRMFLRDSLALRGVKPGADLSKLSSDQKRGMRIVGNVAFPTPADYNYASQCFHILFYNYFTHFTKCNVFLSGWTVDRWIDDPNSDNQYAPQIISGTQLLATNKIAAEIPGYFDEIWEFDKIETGKSKDPVQFVVKFRSALAKTSIPNLPNGNVDITSKNFKNVLFDLIEKGKKHDIQRGNAVAG
jgi:hypothetical protein